jgi:hypothetical protein
MLFDQLNEAFRTVRVVEPSTSVLDMHILQDLQQGEFWCSVSPAAMQGDITIHVHAFSTHSHAEGSQQNIDVPPLFGDQNIDVDVLKVSCTYYIPHKL